MNFLEAHKVVSSQTGGKSLPFLLGMSGTSGKLEIFLRAIAAQAGFVAEWHTIPFNTLMQKLFEPPASDENEVFILLPWDIVPETDWRSGFPAENPDVAVILERAAGLIEVMKTRTDAHFIYINAPVPPLFLDRKQNMFLANSILDLAQGMGAEILQEDVFTLGGYLANGSPFSGSQLDVVAEIIIKLAAGIQDNSCKVLITDLDNVMWHGVIGEDGIDGIKCAPEGVGFRHFIYQSFLQKLKNEGVLLAAVSRNDNELALSPFCTGEMLLNEDDFVCILASYNAKSAQIDVLAKQLNLGLDSFVFVDDNEVELAEVSMKLPDVNCIHFPNKDELLPDLFSSLSSLFSRSHVSLEDKERTELYRRRLKGIVPSDVSGSDITSFLHDLDMKLVFRELEEGQLQRVTQLINKTNQFNLNGRRLSEDEIVNILAAGGHIYSASLSDRYGVHGEILACLIDNDAVIQSLVMSCRVFQRRVEYAFMALLIDNNIKIDSLDYSETPGNEPIRKFLDEALFKEGSTGMMKLDKEKFMEFHKKDLALFSIEG